MERMAASGRTDAEAHFFACEKSAKIPGMRILLAVLAILLVGCVGTDTIDDSKAVESSGAGALSVIYNPDMGFYHAMMIPVAADGTAETAIPAATLLDEDGSYNAYARFNLVHLEIDISAFREAQELKLASVETLLSELEAQEKTAIVRFSYDKNFAGNTQNVEPEDFALVLSHARQICTVIQRHTDAITALECGLLGPWGEMHTTDFAEAAPSASEFQSYLATIAPNAQAAIESGEDDIEKGYIVLLMEQFLTAMDGADIPLLVRQPNFIYNYLKRFAGVQFDGQSVPAQFVPSGKARALGLYNDGFLADKSDAGTFRIDRDDEIAWLDAFTNHTPYGGELIGSYSLADGDTQLKSVHLSFLNIGWNAAVLAKLDKTTAAYSEGESIFKYLLTHIGYRYAVVPESARISFSGTTLAVSAPLENLGFAELPYHRTKSIFFICMPKDSAPTGNEPMLQTSGTFSGGERTLFAEANIGLLSAGEYDLYLKIANSSGKYAIRLDGAVWSDALKANKLGSFRL